VTALFVGGAIWRQKQPHISVSVTLAELIFCCLFHGTGNCDEIPLCKILYFIGYMGLLAE
jgi:hypothetical protein